MERDDAIRKAKAALRRAVDESATPAERDTALRQAKALLRQAGADEIDVRASEISNAVARLDVTRKAPAWVEILVAGISKTFGCRVIYTLHLLEKADIKFVGFAPWNEISAYAFEQLYRQGKNARTAYYDTLSKRRKRKTRTAEANAYAEGWAATVYWRILKPMSRGEDEISHDQDALDRHMDQLDLSPTKGATRQSDNDRYQHAADQGEHDGRNAVLRHGVGMGGKSRALTHQGG